MAPSGFQASRFVNNDYVTAEITYSTAHVRHEALTWTRATFVLGAAPKKVVSLLLPHDCVHWSAPEERI